MAARDLLDDLLAAGFTLDVAAGKVLVTPASALTDDMRAELRACKPELLALLAGPALADDHGAVVAELDHHPDVTQRCTDCQHLTRANTCGEPVAAGLRTPAEGFGIEWPPKGHSAECVAYSSRMPVTAQDRPYRLTKDGADAAHAEPWDDAVIARFMAHMASIQRRGFSEQDAEDLAEGLHLRDLQSVDMVMCLECRHLVGSHGIWRCANSAQASAGKELSTAFVTMLQHCPGSAR